MSILPVSLTSVSLMLLTFPPISQTQLSSAAMFHHAGQAEAYVNAKVSRMYSIPITGLVPLLEVVATDFAIFSILSTLFTLKSKDGEHPFYQRFKNSKDSLNDIASGMTPLLDSNGNVLAGRGDINEVWSDKMDYSNTFWEGPTEEQFVDQDKLNDEADKRGDTIIERLL